MLRWPSVLAWRLRRQHLAERVPRERVMTVVDDISCLHAKVASSAEPTLWARVDDLHRGTRAGWATSGSAAPGMALPKGARAAAEAEAQRLATFLDGELELSWATP